VILKKKEQAEKSPVEKKERKKTDLEGEKNPTIYRHPAARLAVCRCAEV